MTCRRALVAALLAVAVAGATGCSADSGSSAARSTAPEADASSAAPAAPSTPDAAASATPDGDAPVLMLQGDGLGVLAADESVAPLPFGSATTDDVRQAVEDAMGDTAQMDLPDCPQGPRTALDVDGFSVLLDGDTLVGWTDVGAPDRSLTTAEGVGAGSRLEDLLSAVPGTQVTSGATDAQAAGGTTFTSPGGLSGTLTGADPAATISVLSAGQTCPGS